MKPEVAEQLLYESEATLRLVDSLLDELQSVDPHLRNGHVGMHTLQLDAFGTEDEAELPDLLAAASAQASTVLDALARSRGVLERTYRESLPEGVEEHQERRSAVDVRGGLERALLLVDRLEAENGSAPVQRLLRDEILEMLADIRAQEITEQQLSYASSVLRDTELQLSALVHRLSPRRAEVVPFPRSWARS